MRSRSSQRWTACRGFSSRPGFPGTASASARAPEGWWPTWSRARRPSSTRLRSACRALPTVRTPARTRSQADPKGSAGRQLLAQLREQALDAAAGALDHRGELVALRHLHADAGDIDVGNLVPPALMNEVPVDLDAAAVGAHDLAADDGLLAAAPAGAGDAERLAAVLGETGAIGAHDVFLEQREKFLLLLRRRAAPVAPEHEPADARHVEIVVEQYAEPRQALRRRHARPENLNRLCAQIADKGASVLRRSLAWRGNVQQPEDHQADCSGTSHHFAETSPTLGGLSQEFESPPDHCTGDGLGRLECS